MGAPLFGYNVSRSIHSGLNSGVELAFVFFFFFRCFDSKLTKTNFLFFGGHEGKLETFAKICVAASLETLRGDPAIRVRDKQADWKLLSEISRTAPVMMA